MKIKNLRILNKLFGKWEIHVETIYIDKHYTNLLNHLSKHYCACYCITPVNYSWIKETFGLEISQEKYSSLLKDRYYELNKSSEVQLHVHLAQFPQLLKPETREKMIKEAVEWLRGITKINKIVFGWYSSDKFSEKIAEDLGLEVIKQHFHTYDRWL